MSINTNKIIHFDNINDLKKQLSKKTQSTVLTGGCFDIIHIGHIQFLTRAKQLGDILIVLVESDESVSAKKGNNRPFNTQIDRATVLAALAVVDYVILLPHAMDDSKYDRLVTGLKPAIIATTKDDPYIHHKQRQSKLIHAHVVEVVDRIKNISTSTLSEIIGID